MGCTLDGAAPDNKAVERGRLEGGEGTKRATRKREMEEEEEVERE